MRNRSSQQRCWTGSRSCWQSHRRDGWNGYSGEWTIPSMCGRREEEGGCPRGSGLAVVWARRQRLAVRGGVDDASGTCGHECPISSGCLTERGAKGDGLSIEALCVLAQGSDGACRRRTSRMVGPPFDELSCFVAMKLRMHWPVGTSFVNERGMSGTISWSSALQLGMKMLID